MAESLHEFSELYWNETALVAVRLLDHLVTAEFDVQIARGNLRPEFRGDVGALFGDDDSAIVTLRCDRTLWVTVNKTFQSAAGVQNYFTKEPFAAVDDLFDTGLIPAERSPQLTHWQKTLGDPSLCHLHLATLLNEIDIVCTRLTVRVSTP